MHFVLEHMRIMLTMDKVSNDCWWYSHRWTLSGHLWNADSASEFARLWREKPRFIITSYAFDDFLKFGSGDDIDDFAAILLSASVSAD